MTTSETIARALFEEYQRRAVPPSAQQNWLDLSAEDRRHRIDSVNAVMKARLIMAGSGSW